MPPDSAVSGLLAAASTTASPAAVKARIEERNLTFVPRPPAAAVKATLTANAPDRAIVYALLGSRATPAGLAARFREEIVPALPAADRAAAPDMYTLAQGLMARLKTPASDFVIEGWDVGALVPLPVQEDVANTRWVVDLASITAAAAAESDYHGLLFRTPRELEGPDPFVPPAQNNPSGLRQKAAGLVAGSTPANLGPPTARRMLTNPYASAIHTVELIRALPNAAARGQFAAAFVDALSPAHLAVLVATTGGNAVLRRIWAHLPTTAAAAAKRTKVATALGLVADPATSGFFHPWDRVPSVTPVEPPLPDELGRNEPKGPVVYAMAFGRRLHVGYDNFPKRRQDNYRDGSVWYGAAEPGTQLPTPYYEANRASIPRPAADDESDAASRAEADARFAARVKVALLIAGNEGNLDAVRMADRAFLSLGFQQWSFHVDEEGTVLLDRFRVADEDLYDTYLGMFGLWPTPCDRSGRTTDSAANQVVVHNPHAFDAAGAPRPFADYYPSHATLRRRRADAGPIVLGASDMTIAGAPEGRFDAFGWTKELNSKGRDTKRRRASPAWAARSRLALLCAPELSTIQVQLAAHRFSRLQDEVVIDVGQPWCGHHHHLSELFSSECAAALVLDFFINVPRVVPRVITQAWDRTTHAFDAGIPGPLNASARAHDPANPAALNAEFLHRFLLNFAGIRRGRGADGDGRVGRILRLHDDALSGEPGSFNGWQ